MKNSKNTACYKIHRWLASSLIGPVCILLSLIVLLNISIKSPAAVAYGATNHQKQASEYQIKAVYMYNFILFVEWPTPPKDDRAEKTEPEGPKEKKEFILGIVGKDPFGKSFQEVENRIIKPKGKKLVIKRLGVYHKNINLKQCDLLFVCKSEQKNIKRILSRLKSIPTLTIADTKGFLEKGGMINLLKSGKHIRWEINQKPAKNVGLRISSQLLRTAVRVVNTKNHKPANPDNDKIIPDGRKIIRAILNNDRADNE